MSLKSINLNKAYSSDSDDILYDFYIPSLKESIEYDRLAGFFSSKSLAIAARGILGLIEKGGTMRLIISPKLDKRDLEIIIDSYKKPEKCIEEKMLQELERLEDKFTRDHVYALGWMIANKKLEIKVAVACDSNGKLLSFEDIQQSSLFHQKVGILKDSEGNILTFSGSINETAAGWLGNIEEFKVFRNWESSEEDYVKIDILKFNRFWNNCSQKIKIIDMPYAVKEKLIKVAPVDIKKINLNSLYKPKKKIKLFYHQEEAIESWISNRMIGIFEMATGTGKTFAALGCLEKSSKFFQKLVIVITCPYQHLIQQWKKEINKFGIEYDELIIADSSNFSWKDTLTNSLIDISLGYKHKIIILTTHRTFSTNDFKKILQSNKSNLNIFLIADEVHGLGANKSSKGLLKEYNLRLGLSATPKRWFDTMGTNIIYNYFGNIVYEFNLKNAISTINPFTGETYLAPYRYIPKFVSLNAEELEEYIDKTRAIVMKFNKIKNDEDKDSFLETLLFRRADIIKNAERKYRILEELLDEMSSTIRWTIIYCSPQQIDIVMKIVNKRGIIAHRFTMEEGTVPDKKYGNISEREFLLQKFAENKYQVLVAMKCLDEGVDIPPARKAILMASSGNPREYIQRIGRVIRRYPGKEEAIIYDIIVIPSFNELFPEFRAIEWKIFKKEIERYEYIAMNSINNAEALELIYNIKGTIMGRKKYE